MDENITRRLQVHRVDYFENVRLWADKLQSHGSLRQ